MTEHIFKLKPGEELSMKGPIPKFAYKPNEFEVRSLHIVSPAVALLTTFCAPVHWSHCRGIWNHSHVAECVAEPITDVQRSS